MTEEYELSIYDRHELNYDQIALGRLPISVIKDSAIHIIPSLTHLAKGVMEGHSNSRSITKILD
jgi:NAD(P)H-quinone oxidoreductase subunit I